MRGDKRKTKIKRRQTGEGEGERTAMKTVRIFSDRIRDRIRLEGF
jgi:hypothetical protein